MLMPVAMGFVTDAMSKSVSTVIGSTVGVRLRWP